MTEVSEKRISCIANTLVTLIDGVREVGEYEYERLSGLSDEEYDEAYRCIEDLEDMENYMEKALDSLRHIDW